MVTLGQTAVEEPRGKYSRNYAESRTGIGQRSEIRNPAYKTNGNRTKQTTSIKTLFGKENANQTISANENTPAMKNKNKAEQGNTTIISESNTVKQVFGKLYPSPHPYV